MIIPDDEKDSWSFNLSKRLLQWMGFLIVFMYWKPFNFGFVFSKIILFGDIETNYNKLISERLEVLELSKDLKKIKQMDQMVRNTRGKLDIDNPISIEDSTLSIYKLPEKSISQLNNILHPPINGFISKHVSDGGNF